MKYTIQTPSAFLIAMFAAAASLFLLLFLSLLIWFLGRRFPMVCRAVAYFCSLGVSREEGVSF